MKKHEQWIGPEKQKPSYPLGEKLLFERRLPVEPSKTILATPTIIFQEEPEWEEGVITYQEVAPHVEGQRLVLAFYGTKKSEETSTK